MSKKVCVLYGGISEERPVSLRSGKAVIEALSTAGFDVYEIDVQRLEDAELIPEGAIVLPILHGAVGEDGVIQEILEKKGCRFLGSDSTSSKNSFDKHATRQKMIEAGLPVARGDIVTHKTYDEHEIRKIPHVVKVTHGGSSIGTHIVRSPSSVVSDEIQNLLEQNTRVLIEELINGVEVTVPILEDTALPVIEIIPPEAGEFDYQNKYNGKTKEICPSTSLSQETQKLCQNLALQVHRLLECRHLSRVDIMVDKKGNPRILEINTMPGLTDGSLFPIATKVAGYSMPQLVTEFVRMVEETKDY